MCRYIFGRPDWNAWTAIGTLLAVAVALFYEPLRRRWNAAKLRVTWRTRDSENQKVDDFGAVATNVRLLVWNRGRSAAQRVELTVADVCRRSKGGSLKLITNFLPTALRWTHTEAPRCEYLGPNAKRLCN